MSNQFLDAKQCQILFQNRYGACFIIKGLFSYIDEETINSILERANPKQEEIQIYGKRVNTPRLYSVFTEEGVSYKFSGITHTGNPFPTEILEIKGRIEQLIESEYNLCLVNLYRDGKDYIGYHSDNERDIVPQSSIASVSFGATRDFIIRPKKKYKEKFSDKSPYKIQLEHGDLLIMAGDIQTYYEHSLPKRLKVKDRRINLTFRKIIK